MTDTWFTKRQNGKTVHNWLSNFFIEPDGTHVEAEFQAEKHRGHPWRQATILRCKPGHAKKLGRRWPMSSYQSMEWDNRKLQVMHELVKRKIEDHPAIAVALVATADADLTEENWWHDNFWGDCTCLRCYHVGENHLGKIWMALRAEIAE
jgi:ribA/ribD-fused uncharacterized protein